MRLTHATPQLLDPLVLLSDSLASGPQAAVQVVLAAHASGLPVGMRSTRLAPDATWRSRRRGPIGGASVSGERVEPIERPTMDTLPPYVEAKDYLPVRAWVRGFQVDGVVLGWRGDRVYLTWKSDRGNHLGWVPATDVERVQPSACPA